MGPNGPAELAIAANVSWPTSARSVVRVLRHTGLRQAGMRTGLGRLSRTRMAAPATTPPPNQYWRGTVAASAEITRYARPAPSSIPARATGRQVSASAEDAVTVRHLIHPQSPGTCLTSTYISKAQNAAPRVAKLAPPSTG